MKRYKFTADLYRYDLKFKEPAITSRGTYYTHTVWYPVIRFDNKVAIGECAPLPDLSCDFLRGGDTEEQRTTAYEAKLIEIFSKFFDYLTQGELSDRLFTYRALLDDIRDYPSVVFGIETLFAHLKNLIGIDIDEQNKNSPYNDVNAPLDAKLESRHELMLWDTPFSRNQEGIFINGLIWMGDFETMGKRIESKLSEGFRCIKLKIGAIDFDKELSLLSYIRERFSPEELELRVDANGAFSPEEAPAKLEALSKFSLHSIEQPIKAGQYEDMAKLCASTPIPIGLDEEMIGINSFKNKIAILDVIKPQYLVIKPSLHGGFEGTREWTYLARERDICYWLTSALESTIGLNAIAQFVAANNEEKRISMEPTGFVRHKLEDEMPDYTDYYKRIVSMPQGLGTGALYTNNLASPMYIENAKLNCNLNMQEHGSYSGYLNKILSTDAIHVASLS